MYMPQQETTVHTCEVGALAQVAGSIRAADTPMHFSKNRVHTTMFASLIGEVCLPSSPVVAVCAAFTTFRMDLDA